MKNNATLIIFFIFFISFSGCNKHEIINNNDKIVRQHASLLKETENKSSQINIPNDLNISERCPIVSWKFGVGILLYRPKYECLYGFGLCRINAIFVEFDWQTKTAPANIGITNSNEIIIEFLNGIDLSKYAGQNYIEIQDGDEVIDIDNDVVKYFASLSIDLSNISLKKGAYEFKYDDISNNFYIIIPYINN